MCSNGINTGQFDQMIEQIDGIVALQVRYTHKMAHQADDAGYEACHVKLHEASDLLSQVRMALDEARSALEDDAAHGAPNVDIHAV